MDNLARDAMLARKANMSYGRWKAMQDRPVVIEKIDVPEGWRVCKNCGKVFKPNKAAQKFCDIGCRNDAYGEKAKAIRAEYMKKWRERKKGK